MNRNIRWVAGLALPGLVVWVAAGCGSSGDGGPDGGPALRIHGRIVEASQGGGQPSGLSDVDVTAGVDRNGDGRLAGNETVGATSDDDGNYAVEVGVTAGTRVVVAFRSDGLAPLYRTVVAGGQGEAILNVTLHELESMTCSDGACAVDGKEVRISGLPEGVSGRARIFNPVTQPEAFPGGFEESTGKLLISGVFAAVELTDDDGDPLSDLDSPATLRMTLPVDTWGIVIDIQTGTDRIEVPLYAFDEDLGTWVRDGQGHLEDGEGAVIPESELASIRDGSYAGVVVAAGEVDHFSYWNVDWPVDSHGCVTGVVVDADGNPAAGATVSVRGTTYNGSSAPVTTGADGRFCVDVMRSEGAGEDVDQDGITGETQGVAIRVVFQGKVYDAGTFDVGQAQATCAQGGCTDVGSLALTADKVLQVGLCQVTGTVYDVRGNPLADVAVYAWDDTIETEVLAAVCGEYFQDCTYYVTSGEDGSFTVTTGMIEALTLWGWSSVEETEGHVKWRQGQRWWPQCPTEPVRLTLDQGYDSYALTVTTEGNRIDWTPNLAVDLLYVADSSAYKWMLQAEDGQSRFASPVTYGTAPAGAAQMFPVGGGAPAALASGDMVYVVGSTGVSEDGYMIFATGQGTVP